MSISKKHLRKIIKEELKNIKNIRHPALRKYYNKNTRCLVYLKESNGTMKSVSFNSVLKQRKKGVLSEQRVQDILQSSFCYDMKMFDRYSTAYTNLSQHMISEGLITESGRVTQKGRLLKEQERSVRLTESDMRKFADRLLLEQFLEPEKEKEEKEELPAHMQKMSPEEMEAAGIDPSEFKTTGQKVAGAIGKGLKKVGSFLMTPFKAWKWFKDKVWETISGILMKVGGAIKAFSEKFDIAWLKKIVGWVEAAYGAVKKFCNKNKWTKIFCSAVGSICLALAIKAAIGAIMAALGVSMSGLVIAFAAGSACAAGAVAGAFAESKLHKGLLNEDASALCDLAATAATATSNNALNLVKGVIKYLASADSSIGDIAQEALAFVDKYHEILTAAGKDIGLGSGASGKDVMANLLAAAKECKSDGAALVVRALGYIKEGGLAMAGMDGGSAVAGGADKISDAFIRLGKAAIGAGGDPTENVSALLNISKLLGTGKEAAIDGVVRLSASLGFDSIPQWAEASAEALKVKGEIAKGAFEGAADSAGTAADAVDGIKVDARAWGLNAIKAGFQKNPEAFKDAIEKGGDWGKGLIAWIKAGRPALEGATTDYHEGLGRMKQLAGVL